MIPTERAAPAGASWETCFSTRRFALALAIVLLACFAPVFLGWQSFVFRDFGLFGHPLAFYHRESFWRGEIPLWNPLNNCGLPFAAQWNTMVFYPGSLLYLLLPLPWGLCLFCLLHLYFGGVGMHVLARAWTGSDFAACFAGAVFAFNGLALQCLMWPNNVAALGWAPWVLLLLQRAWLRGGWSLLPGSLAGACQLLTGAPEAFLLTWVAATVIWMATVASGEVRLAQSLARFCAVVLIVIAACAVQLLPLLQLVHESQRTSSYDTGGWSMPVTGWANLLLPLFRTIFSQAGMAFQIGQAWTSSYYCGAVTVALALFAALRLRSANVRAFWCLVLLSLIFALGDRGYVWPWLKSHVAALGFFRYPVKFVFLMVAPFALLAAHGLAAFLHDGKTPPVRRAAGAIVAVLLAGMAGLVALGHGQRDWQNAWPSFFANSLVRITFLALAAASLVLVVRATGRRAVLLGLLFLTVVAADLLTQVPWQNPAVPAGLLAPKFDAVRELRAAVPPSSGRIMPSLAAIDWFHRVPATNVADAYMAARLGLSHDLNLLEGIAKANGFYSLYLSGQQEVERRVYRDEENLNPAMADVMAIAQTTAPGRLFDWIARTNSLSLVSAGQEPAFVADTNTIEAMLQSSFDPHTAVLLPVAAKATVTARRQPAAKALVQKFRPHLVEVDVESPGETMVTISQSFYPAWKAYVDGAAVPLWRANNGFQAVQVGAGHHQLRLRYEDRAFYIGAGISGLAALALLISLVASRNARRAFYSPPPELPK